MRGCVSLNYSFQLVLPIVCQGVSGCLRCGEMSRRSQGRAEEAGDVVVCSIGRVRCAPLFFVLAFSRVGLVPISCAAASSTTETVSTRHCVVAMAWRNSTKPWGSRDKFHLSSHVHVLSKRYNAFVENIFCSRCFLFVGRNYACAAFALCFFCLCVFRHVSSRKLDADNYQPSPGTLFMWPVWRGLQIKTLPSYARFRFYSGSCVGSSSRAYLIADCCRGGEFDHCRRFFRPARQGFFLRGGG